MTIEPRGWQAEAVPLAAAKLRAGIAVLMSCCTGSGKSIYLVLLLLELLKTLRPSWGPIVVLVAAAGFAASMLLAPGRGVLARLRSGGAA